MKISAWKKSERPREKLIHQGAQSLSTAELLAILLQTGIQGKNAIDLAQELLLQYGCLRILFSDPLLNSQKIKGLGQAKVVLIRAVAELSRRVWQEDVLPGKQVLHPAQAKNYFISQLRDYDKEVFSALFLNNKSRVISSEELFFGTINEANVYPREVVKRALILNASKVIFAHNHPSGHIQPSDADCLLTQTLKQALALVDIRILDHIIVGHNQSFSFAEHGLL